MQYKIIQAIQIFNQGGIVIFPTDTAFGIGCRIDDSKAVKRLFQIRKRPHSLAIPVLVSGLVMAQQYLKTIPQEVIDKLINKYWPGALTIVLPCLINKVPFLVRGREKNLGVRMPDHEITLQIIQGLEVPILGSSANFHGEKTPYRLEDLDEKLLKQVDLVVEGECKLKHESTVIDCSVKPWKNLRDGAVKLQDISKDN
jgi:L-threonylcarbamoyladenylate synthase